MIDLYSYISRELEYCINIHTIEESEYYGKKVTMGGNYRLSFDNSSLKNHFLTVLKLYHNDKDFNIINCDSSLNRFLEDLDKSNGLIVFDNVSKCKDLEQFNYVIKNKIIIC